MGTPGTFFFVGTNFLESSDDAFIVDAVGIDAAMEACCTACGTREGCGAWDTYILDDGFGYLCQVGLPATMLPCLVPLKQ